MSVESSKKLEFVHVEFRGQVEDKSDLVTGASSRKWLHKLIFKHVEYIHGS